MRFRSWAEARIIAIDRKKWKNTIKNRTLQVGVRN